MDKRLAGEAEQTILALLREERRPLGGHAIAQMLTARGDPMRPSFVFRLLDKLIAKGRAHRVELLSGFTSGPSGQVVHLVCDSCGAHSTVPSGTVGADLRAVAAANSFAPRAFVVEANGRCRRCRAASET